MDRTAPVNRKLMKNGNCCFSYNVKRVFPHLKQGIFSIILFILRSLSRWNWNTKAIIERYHIKKPQHKYCYYEQTNFLGCHPNSNIHKSSIIPSSKLQYIFPSYLIEYLANLHRAHSESPNMLNGLAFFIP